MNCKQKNIIKQWFFQTNDSFKKLPNEARQFIEHHLNNTLLIKIMSIFLFTDMIWVNYIRTLV